MEISDSRYNRDLKLLIAGIGSIGRRHTDVLFNVLGMRRLTLFDPNLGAAEACAGSLEGVAVAGTYAEGLAQKPDAVFVLTPTALHVQYAIEALRAGCHVMIEKPLDVTMDRVGELEALAMEKQKIVSVAFSMRHHALTRKLRQIIDSGVLGRIISIRSSMTEYFPLSRPDYKSTHYVAYSGALELIHAADLAIFLAGGEPRNITGICANRAGLGFRSPDHVETVFETDTGVVCNVTMSFCRIPGGNFIGVYGTEGSLEATYTHGGYQLCVDRGGGKREEIDADHLYRNMQFEGEDAEFLQDITSGRQTGCGVADARRSLKVFTALCQNGVCEP